MRVMGSSLTRWVSGLALAMISGAVFAAATGIAATKHNLSSSGTGPNHTTGTDQICVFCHTPHGSDTSAAVPLWNKNLPAGNSYTVYNSVSSSATSTIDGTIAANVGSVSLACLSCHDGTQAMDNALNRPVVVCTTRAELRSAAPGPERQPWQEPRSPSLALI